MMLFVQGLLLGAAPASASSATDCTKLSDAGSTSQHWIESSTKPKHSQNICFGIASSPHKSAAYDLTNAFPHVWMLDLVHSSVSCSAGLVCSAQQAEPGTLVRYHLGDDSNGKLGWATPSFDDNTWPVAQEGNWPMPPFYSDGFVWVRARMQVPNHIGGTLAIRSADSLSVGTNTELTAADEIFVNGLPVGSQGSFPPLVEAVLNGRETVFDLPPGTIQPVTAAVVAYRVWYPPYLRQASVFGDTRFERQRSCLGKRMTLRC